MTSPVGIGCIGLGSIWRGVHLPGISQSPDLALRALCDNDPAALESGRGNQAVASGHCYCFSDYRDLIACPDVQAVSISTPNDAHFEIALAAARAGKPFCLEKPVTLTAAQADILADAARNIPNMVCFSYRFRPAARAARQLVRSGKLGRVFHVNMQYFQGWGISDAPLVWRMQKGRAGSGALGDLGSHALDLVRFIAGGEYTDILARHDTFTHERKLPQGGMGKVDVDDLSCFITGMTEGVTATFQISRFAFGRGNYQRMEVYGSEGALVYDLDAEPGAADRLFTCTGPEARANRAFTPYECPQAPNQMQCFADLLLGRGDGLSATLEDGRRNQHALDAVLCSAETGTPVYI